VNRKRLINGKLRVFGYGTPAAGWGIIRAAKRPIAPVPLSAKALRDSLLENHSTAQQKANELEWLFKLKEILSSVLATLG
jgi:hypothetical protein